MARAFLGDDLVEFDDLDRPVEAKAQHHRPFDPEDQIIDFIEVTADDQNCRDDDHEYARRPKESLEIIDAAAPGCEPFALRGDNRGHLEDRHEERNRAQEMKVEGKDLALALRCGDERYTQKADPGEA